MALYRLYVDEVGNHDLTHADNPNQRFLSLTGVALESRYNLHVFHPEFDQLKREFFQIDVDEPVIFHRKEMVNRRTPFEPLREAESEQRFNTALLLALARWEYVVLTIVLDKQAHREQFEGWRYHPYHYCLTALLERFVSFLQRDGHRGDVMIESRKGKEDRQLKAVYTRLCENGTDHVPPEVWHACLTSRQLKFNAKEANIAGLQLADLLAHPSQREVLIEHHLIVDDRSTFGNQICAILRHGKYYQNKHTGQIEDYGKKLLP